jgi:hypothetical protein
VPETFSPLTWRNDQTPALSESNLNRLEVGVEAIDDRVHSTELGIVAPVVVPHATSVTLNATQGSLFRCIALGDVTLDDIVGGTDGQTVTFEVQAFGATRSLHFTGVTGSVDISSGQWWIGVFRYVAADATWLLDDSSGGGTSDEQIRDAVAGALVPGPNVTITPNDATDTITISAAGTGIPATTVDAKGDLLVATAADTVVRKAVGANAAVLKANSASSDGVEWGAVALAEVTGLQVALDAKAAAAVAINSQAGSYTFVLADVGRAVHSTAAVGVTYTVPPSSSVAFPSGAVILVAQMGAGQVAVAAGAGVTVRTAASLTTRAQYSEISLRKIATDEWLLAGDLT